MSRPYICTLEIWRKLYFSPLMMPLTTSDASIMPPGQMHGVNTPNASFCRGGHWFNLDTMHLTELSRFVDVSNGNFVTNHSHRGTLETLCRLVLALPILPRTRSELFSSHVSRHRG